MQRATRVFASRSPGRLLVVGILTAANPHRCHSYRVRRALERLPARPERGPRRFGDREGGEGGFGGREGYRREGGFGRGGPREGGEDKAGAPGAYQPRFGGGGGFGRGAAPPPQ